ncbi:hypothetical protein [Marivita sp. S2033]|uniref:hypothetical protein n=1 Tax=Marivita sp. S2033 TaxID=3373187 RepID=UPI00398277AF
MIYFSLCLLGLFCFSRITFAEPRRAAVLDRSVYRTPPPDWPDVPITSLGLFQPLGRINTPVMQPILPTRLYSFEEAQDFVLQQADLASSRAPEITLRLSELGGPEWTDILLDGEVRAQVSTAELTSSARASNARGQAV